MPARTVFKWSILLRRLPRRSTQCRISGRRHSSLLSPRCKGVEIYREGDRAQAVFNIISGVVKAYQQGPNDTEQIAAFLFSEDLFGLAQEDPYANSIKTLTPVTAYRIPVNALRSRLRADAALEFHVIAKPSQELRQAQRHAFLLANKRTLPKLAMFLQMLEQLQAAKGDATNEIYVPINRSDMAEYVGVSLAALSRAFGTLATRGNPGKPRPTARKGHRPRCLRHACRRRQVKLVASDRPGGGRRICVRRDEAALSSGCRSARRISSRKHLEPTETVDVNVAIYWSFSRFFMCSVADRESAKRGAAICPSVCDTASCVAQSQRRAEKEMANSPAVAAPSNDLSQQSLARDSNASNHPTCRDAHLKQVRASVLLRFSRSRLVLWPMPITSSSP
jgi:CRP-like cAMP-binding protein